MLRNDDAARAQLKAALAVVLKQGDVAELRIPKAGKDRTISGYYDDLDRLVEDIVIYYGKAPGMYVTANPVKRDLLARAANRAKPYAEATTEDKHIVRRRWLLIDGDPVRDSGISSTDAEHEAALQRARDVAARLRSEGWPDPVVADSGNGAHLLYAIDLPNDDEATVLVHDVLKALAARHDDAVVTIDQTVYNAARIWKIYGTVAAKGDSTPERPHRLARIIEAPTLVQVVDTDLLRKLAAEAPPREAKRPPGQADRSHSTRADQFDVQGWFARCGVEVVRGPHPCDGGTKWIVHCPNNAEHKDAAVFQAPDGKLGYKCFHNSCRDMDWRQFREHYEPGCYAHQRGATAGVDGDEDSGTKNFTDLGNARRFAERYRGRIRYVHAWNKWLTWDERRWAADSTGHIERLAKRTIKAMWDEVNSIDPDLRANYVKHVLKSEHKDRIRAMIVLAQSEPGIPITAEELDGDRQLLNVMNGTVDLRTGELRPPDPRDYITKLAPVRFNPGAKARTFMRFLLRAMRGHRHVIRYIQRAIGYSLTGDCREQVVFFCFGVGANGKSKLLNAISGVLGTDYAIAIPAESLLAKKYGDGIPNDIARLKGMRFVVATELEGTLNEGKLKKLTGEDRLTARFMRAEFFDFLPEFKLWVACNHKPKIEGSGHSMWRRMRLIPFDVVIPDALQDKTLGQKLEAEAEGILAWAVKGCLDWQKHGLGTPDAVTEATDAYRVEMDAVGRFVSESTELVAGERVTAADLWVAYNLWCGNGEENPVSNREFGGKLTGHAGITRARGGANGQVVYDGLRLKPDVLKELKELNLVSINRYNDVIKKNIEKILQTEGSSFSKRKPATSETGADPSATEKEWVV